MTAGVLTIYRVTGDPHQVLQTLLPGPLAQGPHGKPYLPDTPHIKFNLSKTRGLSLIAVAGMPVLARRKRTIAARIGSAALRGDAACSITCAYMAATLLVGLVLTTLVRWWWADSLAALGLLYWLSKEAREALEGARAGRGGCSCGDDGCRTA